MRINMLGHAGGCSCCVRGGTVKKTKIHLTFNLYRNLYLSKIGNTLCDLVLKTKHLKSEVNVKKKKKVEAQLFERCVSYSKGG